MFTSLHVSIRRQLTAAITRSTFRKESVVNKIRGNVTVRFSLFEFQIRRFATVFAFRRNSVIRRRVAVGPSASLWSVFGRACQCVWTRGTRGVFSRRPDLVKKTRGACCVSSPHLFVHYLYIHYPCLRDYWTIFRHNSDGTAAHKEVSFDSGIVDAIPAYIKCRPTRLFPAMGNDIPLLLLLNF